LGFNLNFVDDIKIIRLGWVGQIIRMEERIPMKILNGEFHNTGSVGKPRTRGKDIVQRDALQGLGMRTEEMSWLYRRMEAIFEKGLNPEGAVE
jgi:hypothetical protein